MTRAEIRHTFEIIMFLILLVGAFFLLPVAARRIDGAITDFRDYFLGEFEAQTGLAVSYSSLSPSLLRSLHVKDLRIRDATTGAVLASVTDLSVSYNFGDLLRGNVPGSIREISVRSASVSIDRAREAELFSRLAKIARTGKKPSFLSRLFDSLSDGRTVKIRLRRIDVSVTDGASRWSGTVSQGLATLDRNGLSFNASSVFSGAFRPVLTLDEIKADAQISGFVDRSFTSGTGSVIVNSLSSGPYSVRRVGFVLSYRDSLLDISSRGSLEPIDVHATVDLSKHTVAASFECENFLPLRWLRVDSRARLKFPPGLSSATLTGRANFLLARGAYPEFSADLSASIPSSVYGGGIIRVSCSEKAGKLEIPLLSAVGSRIDAEGSLFVDIPARIPEGMLSVKRLVVRKGVDVSGDVYVQREKNGFGCLIPELAVNEGRLSAVEVGVSYASGSFSFSASAYDSSGQIAADGSITMGQSKFLQLYASFDTVSVQNAANVLVPIALPDADARSVSSHLASYALTTEVYVSTDFHSFSFNCTRLIFASDKKNGLYLLLSAKGNQNGVDLTDIALSKGSYAITGNIASNFDEAGGILFNVDCAVNGLPYTATGSWGHGVLTLYGDYGLACSAIVDPSGGVSGSIAAHELPIPVDKYLFSLSLNAGFEFFSSSDWRVSVNEGSIEEMGNVLPLSTVFSFSALINPSGVNVTSMSVADRRSVLTGFMDLNLDPGVASFSASLSSADATETVGIGFSVSRDQLQTITGHADFRGVPLMRFLPGQPASSVCSFSAEVSGTIPDPRCTVKLIDSRCLLNEYDLTAKGLITADRASAVVSDASVSWRGLSFSQLTGSADFAARTASVETDFSSILGSSAITSHIALNLASEKPGETEALSPETLAEGLQRVTLTCAVSDTKWKSFSQGKTFVSTVTHEPGMTLLSAGANDAISGYLLDDGSFSLDANESLPLSFRANGAITSETVSLQIDDILTDLPRLGNEFGIPVVKFDSGTLSGSLSLTGLLSDPDFNGSLHGSSIRFEVPKILAGTYGPTDVEIIGNGKRVSVPEITVRGANGSMRASCDIEFDRWLPSTIDAHIATVADETIKVDVDNQYLKAKGFAAYDLSASITHDAVSLDGDMRFERGSLAVLYAGNSSSSPSVPAIFGSRDRKLNVNLSLGQKVEFLWPNDDFPIIRGLLQADAPIVVDMDTGAGTFSVRGVTNLKGGEIFYIKRNFYLRKGTITFNENQDVFDPLIAIQAEIRERDEDGAPVRIILTVNDQPLSSFTPVITSDPTKTDAEIMALLGQATSADASRESLLKDTVVSASDVLTQISLFRKFENGIRDLLGLDLFSVRTLILQNALLGNSSQSTTERSNSVGNYFDNTTVYMGKYFGSAFYADALLHFNYYDPLTTQNTGEYSLVYQNLLLQPEIGLEVTTPLFLFRWNFTPAHPDTLFVQDNSITLSWKFSY